MLSVIIPSRVDQYLQRTIDELLEKAKGDIEIIVVLDGYWPKPALKDDPRVVILHQGTVHNNPGMRAAINQGVALAKGEFIMKIDEHCMVDEGFDLKLAEDCGDTDLIIPRRYRLDADAWKVIEDGRAPVDYMFIAYPYERPFDRRCGLYGGGIDKQRTVDRKDVLIDETMSFQGSCYFCKKDYWNKLIAPLDDVNYGAFNHEAQEIGFKVQLSGGRVLVNKKTWYAHLHKGRSGKGYGFSNEQYRKHETSKEKSRRYAMNYWLNDRWEERKHDFAWLIEKFNPPGWGPDWQERIKKDAEKDWSKDPTKQPSEWIDLEKLEI